MKISREARQTAKRLYVLCQTGGRMDEKKVSTVAKALAERKPRGYMAVLMRFQKLVTLEVRRKTVTVDSAVTLSDQGKQAVALAESKFGPALAVNYRVRPELIGGLRVQVGSDVWDGTIRARLDDMIHG